MPSKYNIDLYTAKELVKDLDQLEVIDWIQVKRESECLSFATAVYLVTALIPKGRVLGYGHIAGLIGSPRAARQVGYALRSLKAELVDLSNPECIPWWRVIRSHGQIATNSGGHLPDQQAALLLEEGIAVANYKLSMQEYAWRPNQLSL